MANKQNKTTKTPAKHVMYILPKTVKTCLQNGMAKGNNPVH